MFDSFNPAKAQQQAEIEALKAQFFANGGKVQVIETGAQAAQVTKQMVIRTAKKRAEAGEFEEG